jgi:uncharacterized membrane protein YesL
MYFFTLYGLNIVGYRRATCAFTKVEIPISKAHLNNTIFKKKYSTYSSTIVNPQV